MTEPVIPIDPRGPDVSAVPAVRLPRVDARERERRRREREREHEERAGELRQREAEDARGRDDDGDDRPHVDVIA